MKLPSVRRDLYQKLSRSIGAETTTRLHFRQDLHLARKLWHMMMGIFIVAVYMSGISRDISLRILSVSLIFFLVMETARLRFSGLNQKAIRLWGPLMRSHEVHRYSGIPYYVASALISIAVFPQPVAVLCLLYLAIGDPVASLFGILYGDRSIRFASGKSLVGMMAGVTVCTLITLVYLSGLHLGFSKLLILAAVGGFAGGVAEMLPFEIDDNFVIPVVSGFILWLAFILMGI